jgi:hypothetical protein
MLKPPVWDRKRLLLDLATAQARFRKQRMEEPLEAYLEAFDECQGLVADLLEASVDLTELESAALDILTNTDLFNVFRYLAGPPISSDDLSVVAEATFSRKQLEANPEMVARLVDTIRLGLDRRRFPWVAEEREPTEEEKAAAILASAAMLAHSRVGTSRRNESKREQEELVESALLGAGLKQVETRSIPMLNKAPGPGQFCRESVLGPHHKDEKVRGRKADIIVGLWDGRVMPIECKVSNSAVNSVKRLNNDAAVKAETWFRDFGQIQVVPTAVLSGVYNIGNLVNAQERGLTLFWAHDLKKLINWIQKTKH